ELDNIISGIYMYRILENNIIVKTGKLIKE
ncbi:MAG: hypothetical protein JWO32_1700, partial [Bacteroidetes bacterium]|nr:hypothetical protein [Bacteroidota bacterium]